MLPLKQLEPGRQRHESAAEEGTLLELVEQFAMVEEDVREHATEPPRDRLEKLVRFRRNPN